MTFTLHCSDADTIWACVCGGGGGGGGGGGALCKCT